MFIWVLAIPLMLGLLSFFAARRYQESIAWVSHTQNVLVALKDLLVTIADSEIGQRGYLLTGEEPFFQQYTFERNQLAAKISHLRQLTADNAVQQANLSRLSTQVRNYTSKMQWVLALERQGQLPTAEAVNAMRDEAVLLESIQKTCEAMRSEESRLLGERTEAERNFEIEMGVMFALGIGISNILLFFAYRLIRQYAAERDQAEARIRQMNADLQTRIDERTAELQEANERLSKSNKDLTQFAYVASHDLQEPLRTVGSYAGLLGRRYQGKLDEQADKYIRFMVDGAKRMQMLVQDLLAYSRVGTQAVILEPVDMEAVLSQAKENLRLSIAEASAIISHDPLPHAIGDAARLVQVFQNLIGNSLKFAKPDEPPRIKITAQRQSQEWIFEVSDSGIGFDAKYAERIFVIFQRLHQVGAYPGTGIGLAICQRVIEAHGGRIWAESEPGLGSRFYFSLPAELPPRSTGGRGLDGAQSDDVQTSQPATLDPATHS